MASKPPLFSYHAAREALSQAARRRRASRAAVTRAQCEGEPAEQPIPVYRACAGRQIVEQLLQALALAPRVAMPALGEVEVVPAQEEEEEVMMLEAVLEAVSE